MAVTIGSGLGGFAAIAAQPTYGAALVTPTRVLMLKSGKATWDPHLVYGGPYLEGGITIVPGAARVATWLDAHGTLMGDVTDTAHALLLKVALASPAALSQLGTTTAWELGGASGANMGVADTNGSWFDMQWGAPDANTATQRPYTYHSCVITKAEWVFDRAGLVTYSYDFDAQYVETTTAIITPTYPTNAVAFNMTTATSLFKIGPLASEVVVDGVKKATFTLERPMALDRIYLGNTYKDQPVTNSYVNLSCTLEADFTTGTKTQLFDLFLANTPISVIATAVGSVIGGGNSRTFGLQMTNAFIDSNAEPNIDGPDIIKSSLTLKGTIDAASDAPLKAICITPDVTF
jgi:hypothetical protein